METSEVHTLCKLYVHKFIWKEKQIHIYKVTYSYLIYIFTFEPWNSNCLCSIGPQRKKVRFSQGHTASSKLVVTSAHTQHTHQWLNTRSRLSEPTSYSHLHQSVLGSQKWMDKHWLWVMKIHWLYVQDILL